MPKTARPAALAVVAVLLGSLAVVSPSPTVPNARAAGDVSGYSFAGDKITNLGTPSQQLAASPVVLDVLTYDPGPTNAHLILYTGGTRFLFGHANGTLAPGTYENASIGGYAADRPRLDLPITTYTCQGTPVGRFVILEGPVVVNGNVTSFSADYEIRCDGRTQARGSVRMNASTPMRLLQVTDQLWDTIPVNARISRTFPVSTSEWYGSNTIGAPQIEGPDATSFTLDASTCPVGVLAPGASCSITVTYDPVAEGAAHGVLRLPIDWSVGDYLIDLDGTALPPDLGTAPGSTTTSLTTFYPYPDGYKDGTSVRGYVNEPCTIEVEIRSSTGAVVRRINAGAHTWDWSTPWDGKNGSGTRVAAGTYTVIARYTDVAGNTAARPTTVIVSAKRLYTYSASISKHADQFAARGTDGAGTVSRTSAYARGRKVVSGASGYAALGYSFSIPSATVYKKFTFKVTGRSPNGRFAAIGIQDFRISKGWYADAFNPLAAAGPSYATWSVSTSEVAPHRTSRTVRGMVYVEPTSSGGSRTFDFAKVTLTVTYALLK